MHDEVSGPRAQGAERVFNPAGQLELGRARLVPQTAFTVIHQDPHGTIPCARLDFNGRNDDKLVHSHLRAFV
jgi:hypothetical protein